MKVIQNEWIYFLKDAQKNIVSPESNLART